MTIHNLDFGTGGNNDGEFLRTAFPKIQANFEYLQQQIESIALGGEQGLYVNVCDPAYGAIKDSTTDNTAAFNLALATGRAVFVPDDETGDYYRVDGPLVFQSNQALIGAESKPKIKLGSAANSLLFDLDFLSDVLIASLTIDGNKSVTPTNYLASLISSTRCHIQNCKFIDLPGTNGGGIILGLAATGCSVRYCTFIDAEGTPIALSGTGVTGNEIIGNDVTDSGGFGIRVGEGANRNLIAGNKTFSNGLELIGITYNCWGNRIEFNHAEGTGDAGISVTGFHNTVLGNVCRRNIGIGITIWGSRNTVSANVCTNNGQGLTSGGQAGIGIFPAFGGLGQYNTIVGNFCDDDQAVPTQAYGIYLHTISYYTPWTSGASFTAGAYCRNGLHAYRATTTGTTGVSAPVHTSGSVSDGGVTWEYHDSWIADGLAAASTSFNTVANNVIKTAPSGTEVDASTNWRQNTLISQTLGITGSLPSIGVGLKPTWTGLNQFHARAAGNVGVILEGGNTSIARFACGKASAAALSGGFEYDFATDTMALYAGGSKRLDLTASALTSNVPFAVPDDAYAAGWNGSANVPTKNAVYDKIESLSSVYQPLDADLSAIAGLTSAADKGIYFTGSGTAATFDLSSVARTLLAQTSQANMRSTGLGLGSLAVLSTVNNGDWSGTDLSVANGGTGASTEQAACANLHAPYLHAFSAVQANGPGSSTAENTLATIAIPANALGSNGWLEIEAEGTATNNANTKTFRVKYGGTEFLSQGVTTAGRWYVKVRIHNRNATNSQRGVPVANRGTDGLLQNNAATSGSVDTTTALDVIITEQRNTGTDSTSLESYTVTIKR